MADPTGEDSAMPVNAKQTIKCRWSNQFVNEGGDAQEHRASPTAQIEMPHPGAG